MGMNPVAMTIINVLTSNWMGMNPVAMTIIDPQQHIGKAENSNPRPAVLQSLHSRLPDIWLGLLFCGCFIEQLKKAL